jgi:hypothetical protein
MALTRAIHALNESIASCLGTLHAAAQPDPFAERLLWLNLSADQFASWRSYFKTHSRRLASDISRIFNERRKAGVRSSGEGGAFVPPELDASVVQDAFEHPQRFDRKLFDMFTGSVKGDLRIYTEGPKRQLEEVPAPLQFSTWGDVRESRGMCVQQIAGSNHRLIDPDSKATVVQAIREESADLYLNVYSEEWGIASWTTFYQNHANQMRSIGYSLGDKLLWINQLLNPDMKPTIGPLPLPGGPVVTPNQLILSVDREVQTAVPNPTTPGRPVRHFEVYAIHVNFFGGIFGGGGPRADFAGPILKLANSNERVVQIGAMKPPADDHVAPAPGPGPVRGTGSPAAPRRAAVRSRRRTRRG